MKKTKNSPQAKNTTTPAEAQHDLICVGLDVHAASTTAVHALNHCQPRPARKFQRHNSLFEWLRDLQAETKRLVVCMEAGPCGYWMARAILAKGIECIVVAPKKWSENGKVKTDARDARVLCDRLYQWAQGKANVFTLVTIPTVDQEKERQLGRTLKTLKKQHKSIASSGRGQGLLHGISMKGRWWDGPGWEELPEGLCEALTPFRKILLELEKQIRELNAKVEALCSDIAILPKGLGQLTDGALNCEVMDWGRFQNRRQIGGFIGMVPGESSSGPSQKSLPITKAGSGELRRLLVQAAWRLVRFQPEWHVAKKWQAQLDVAPKWRRKQIIVAIARSLMIDLWRLKTGQTTMQKLGLEPC